MILLRVLTTMWKLTFFVYFDMCLCASSFFNACSLALQLVENGGRMKGRKKKKTTCYGMRTAMDRRQILDVYRKVFLFVCVE